jgi:hypothetical protein
MLPGPQARAAATAAAWERVHAAKERQKGQPFNHQKVVASAHSDALYAAFPAPVNVQFPSTGTIGGISGERFVSNGLARPLEPAQTPSASILADLSTNHRSGGKGPFKTLAMANTPSVDGLLTATAGITVLTRSHLSFEKEAYNRDLDNLSKATGLSKGFLDRRLTRKGASFADFMHAIATVHNFRKDVALSCLIATGDEKSLTSLPIEHYVSTPVSSEDSTAVGPRGIIPGLRAGMGVFPIASPDMSFADALYAWGAGRADVLASGLVEVIFTSLDSKKNKDDRIEKKKVISRATTESGNVAVNTALSIKKRGVDAAINATFAERRNFAEDKVKLTRDEVKKKVEEIQTRHANTLQGNRSFMKEVDNFYCVATTKFILPSGLLLAFPQITANVETTFPLDLSVSADPNSLNETEALFKDNAPPSASFAMLVIVGSSAIDVAQMKGGGPLNLISTQISKIRENYERGLKAAIKTIAKSEEKSTGKRKLYKEAEVIISDAGKMLAKEKHDKDTGGFSITIGKGKKRGKNTATISLSSSIGDYTTSKLNMTNFSSDPNGATLVQLFANYSPMLATRKMSSIPEFTRGEGVIIFFSSHLRDDDLICRYLQSDSTIYITGRGNAWLNMVRNSPFLYPGEEVPSVYRSLRDENNNMQLTLVQKASREKTKLDVVTRAAGLCDDLCSSLKGGFFESREQVLSFFLKNQLLGRLDPTWVSSKYACPCCRSTLDRLDINLVQVQCSNPTCGDRANPVWCCGDRAACGEYLSIKEDDDVEGEIVGDICCNTLTGKCTCDFDYAKSSVDDRHDWICSGCVTQMLGAEGSDFEKRDAMRLAIFNRPPSPIALPVPLEPDGHQDDQFENKESLGHLKKGLCSPGDSAERKILYQQYLFDITVDRYFPRATFGQIDPGICSLVAETIYAEMHVETPIPPLNVPAAGPSTLEPMASLTVGRTNGASNSNISNTDEPDHEPTPKPPVNHQVIFDLAQSLHVAVQTYCGGGSLKVTQALDKLRLLGAVLSVLFADQADPLPVHYPSTLQELTVAALGEARTKAAKSLQAWSLLLKKNVLKNQRLKNAAAREATREAARAAFITASTSASSASSSASSSAAASPPPPPQPPSRQEKKEISNLTRLAINTGKASQARLKTRIAKFSKPSNPEGGGDKLMVEEVNLRTLLACQNFVKNTLNPNAPLAPGDDDDTAMHEDSSATEEDAEDDEMSTEGPIDGGSNAAAPRDTSSSSSSSKIDKKEKKKQAKAKKAAEAKAKAMSDFEDSGPSAKIFIEAVRTEKNPQNLRLLLVALKSKIKLVRAYNAARLDSFHHLTAMAVARGCGINSCVSNPRVEYTQGWKKMLKGSTTGSYMQLAAPARFVMILARLLLRFGSKLICPDETYTSMTCLSCRSVRKRSADRTMKCTSCKLHTHRDIHSTGNIAIRSIILGQMVLKGLCVA